MREMSTDKYGINEDALQEAFDILSNKARGKIFGKTQEYVSMQLECLVKLRSDKFV